jgi:hypothetical protein
MTATDYEIDPRFIAGTALIGRTGAQTFRIGYSDPDDGEPTVWYAVATWRTMTAGPTVHLNGAEAAGGLSPVRAVMRLCEKIIDGGTCTHCHQMTIFDDNPGDSPFDTLLAEMGCVYAWDPELQTFRRGCEGDT